MVKDLEGGGLKFKWQKLAFARQFPRNDFHSLSTQPQGVTVTELGVIDWDGEEMPNFMSLMRKMDSYRLKANIIDINLKSG